jgi:hypothetical protein
LHQEFSAAQGQSAVPAASFTLRTIVSKKDAEASEVAHVKSISSMDVCMFERFYVLALFCIALGFLWW